MHRLILLATMCALGVFRTDLALSQTVEVDYLQPGHTSTDYDFVRFGTATEYPAGFMYNKTNGVYSNGDDFTISRMTTATSHSTPQAATSY